MTTAEHAPAATGGQTNSVGVRHPLDPLTAEEIEEVSRILKRDRGLAASARFVYVTLAEPAKDAVLSHQPGETFDREADVVLRERAEGKTYEAVVSITAGQVRLWRRGRAQPSSSSVPSLASRGGLTAEDVTGNTSLTDLEPSGEPWLFTHATHVVMVRLAPARLRFWDHYHVAMARCRPRAGPSVAVPSGQVGSGER